MISKNRVIQYESNGSVQKFYVYEWLMYAYSNFSTSAALRYNVLSVTDFVKVMYFKDA